MQELKKPKKQLDVTAGPLARPLVRFCVPLILTSIMQLLFNACDIIVVGQFVGSAAVAAVGSTLFLINVFMTFFVAMSAGVTIILSTDFGRKDHNSIVRGAHTAICLGILFGFGVLAVGVTCARTFLTWTSTPKEILDQAALYLRIYYAGSPFFLLYTFGRAVLITTGDTRRPMIYLAISGLANVALNLFLVIQCHLGVAGVAIGTISSQLISAILVLRRLSMIEGPCHIYFHKLKLHRELVRRIFRQGLPSGVQSSIFSFSNILIQTSINSLGKAYIAASSASGNLEGFVWMSMDAVCQSGMTFTGQNYGAMQPDRIKKVFRLSALYSTIVSLAMGIPIAVFGHSLLGIYLPDDPAAVHAGLIRLTIS